MATEVTEPRPSSTLTVTEKEPRFGVRHKQAILALSCIFFGYSMRANLNVGIVAMTSKDSNSYYSVLPWSTFQKGIVLGSFSLGLLVQIPAEYFSLQVGTRYPLFGGVAIAAFATLLLPFLALNSSWIVVCLSRVVNGLAQGFIHTFVNSHLKKWAPLLERSKTSSFVHAGAFVGTLVTNLVAGFLASSYGWPSIFYVTGLCGLLCAAVWLLLSSNSPATDATISPQEKEYITARLEQNMDHFDSVIPWCNIITSVPFWALLVAQQGFGWGFVLLYTMTPSYLNHVLGFTILQTGLISSIPFLAIWILATVFSWLSDSINAKQMFLPSFNRKMWNSIGLWGAALALLCLPLTTTAAEDVLVITISTGLIAGVFSGSFLNHSDLAPNFAEILIGISSGLAAISSFLAPSVTGLIVQDETRKRDWMNAFYIAAAVIFVSNLLFIAFGSTAVQSWNTPKNSVNITVD